MELGLTTMLAPELSPRMDALMHGRQGTVKAWSSDSKLRHHKQHHAQPHWVPNPPLLSAPSDTEWVPFPESTGMAGFWEVHPDKSLSTPFPTPIHQIFRIGSWAQHIQSLVPGILVEETSKYVRTSMSPLRLDGDTTLCKLPAQLLTYNDMFFKDNAVHTKVGPCRDITIGKMQSQGFMSKDGTLYGRFIKSSLLCNKVEWICEDVGKLDASGTILTIEQFVRDSKGRTASHRMTVRRRRPAADSAVDSRESSFHSISSASTDQE